MLNAGRERGLDRSMLMLVKDDAPSGVVQNFWIVFEGQSQMRMAQFAPNQFQPGLSPAVARPRSNQFGDIVLSERRRQIFTREPADAVEVQAALIGLGCH